jgi:hypothetical protein
VIQKKPRGRPRARIENEQIALRLPRFMVQKLREAGHSREGLSSEIRERLYRSLFDDARDPQLWLLEGQIEQLAKEVKFNIGADFHADKIAHRVFLETLKLLFADLVEPSAQISTIKADPKAAAELIYNRLKATGRNAEPTMRPTIKHLLENDDG